MAFSKKENTEPKAQNRTSGTASDTLKVKEKKQRVSKDKRAKPRKKTGTLRYLGGLLMAKMAISGAAELRKNADEVNKLNVFPVPDGDTGDNMRMTIESGIAAIERLDTDDLSEIMRAFSHGMLLGARGNSGVILSQFFSGTAKGLEGVGKADPVALGHALELGVKQAYASVMTPTEGTILTVAREAVEYAVKRITPESTVRTFFADLVKEMHESLDRTPETLPILKEAEVVDSGGAGLLYIIDGFNRVLNGKSPNVNYTDKEASNEAKNAPKISLDAFGPDSVMTYGYCTELLVRAQNSKCDAENFDIEPLKAFLATVGDSIVAFKTGTAVKIHVHTLTPEKVLEYCRTFGEFLTVKIENMSLQHTVKEADEGVTPTPVLQKEGENEKIQSERKRYGIVAVASGEGLENLFHEFGADVVIRGGQTHNPSTSEFLEAFGTVNAEHIFVLPNNGNIMMAAAQAAEMYDGAEVYVIDAKNIGLGYAAISTVDLSSDTPQTVIKEMQASMASVVTGYISPSIRDADIGGVHIQNGDTMGIIGKEIVVSEPEGTLAVKKLASILLDGRNMLTVFTGKDAGDEEKAALEAHVRENCPNAEIYFLDGGQEIYPFIFVAE